MSYTCPVCGRTSQRPEDEEQGYCGNCHAVTREPAMTQWVIYDHPRDMPNSWVMREWHIYNGMTTPVPGNVVVAPNLEGARMFVPRHAVRLDRSPDDDPTILEVWL